MFNARSKIIKKEDVSTFLKLPSLTLFLQAKPTDLEDEVAKCLYQLEMSNASLKEHLAQIFINSAELVEYQQQDGSASKCLFVRIPFRSITAFHKVNEKAVQHLEQKFSWPVIVIASRTIVSKRGKTTQFEKHLIILPVALRHRTQMRPRTRTLQNVH